MEGPKHDTRGAAEECYLSTVINNKINVATKHALIPSFCLVLAE